MNNKSSSTQYLIFIVLALVLLKLPFIFKDPFFAGDAGSRLDSANQFITLAGKRAWLPFLQAQIWTLYKLRLPYYTFKLIPLLYFSLAIFCLGKLTYKIIGNNLKNLFFLTLILLSFSYHWGIIFLSVSLHQEILEIALFYILLCLGALDLKKSISLLLFAGIALFTRDSFWVYLFVLSLLNYKKIFPQKTYLYSIAALWIMPLLWTCLIPFIYLSRFARWPQWPLEWPLMINKHTAVISKLSISSQSIWTSMLESKMHFLLLGLSIAWIAKIVYYRKTARTKPTNDPFTSKFKTFSLISLTIIYSFIWLFDPFTYTFGNHRMMAPLLSHLFIWAIIAYKQTFYYPNILKKFVRAIVVLSLLLTIHTNFIDWLPQDNSATMKLNTHLTKLQQNTNKSKLTVSIVGRDYWHLLRQFIAPTLYMKRRFITEDKEISDQDDIIISATDTIKENDLFAIDQQFHIGDRNYTIYLNKRIN